MTMDERIERLLASQEKTQRIMEQAIDAIHRLEQILTELEAQRLEKVIAGMQERGYRKAH